MIPADSAMELTTSSLEEFFPGLEEAFGEDLPMSVKISALEFPKAIMLPGQMGGNLQLGLDFIVENSGRAFLMHVVDAQAFFEVTLKEFLLYISFDDLHIGDVTLTECAIPEFETKGLKTTLNLIAKLLVPTFNMILSKGIRIPDHYFQNVCVKDASFTSFQDYVKIQFEPTILN